MGDDGQRDDQEDERRCQRCSKPMELLTIISRTSANPKFWIYGCGSCGFVDWVAEKIGPATT